MSDLHYADYYGQYLPLDTVQDNDEAPCLCPLHEESNPSFSVNLRSGLWMCHGCGRKGDVYRFHELFHKVAFPEAKNTVDAWFEDHQDTHLDPIPDKVVLTWHKALLGSAKKKLEWLTEKRGISLAVIEQYQIGWDGERFTIPVRNKADQVANVRRYSPDAKSTDKMISYGTGYGKARLFPLDSLQNPRVVVCEGEMDTLCCLSRGIPAVTSTSGAGSWDSRFNYRFCGKEIYIVYDIDPAGKAGSRRVAEQLAPVATVRIVDLPIQEPANADLTDYFMSHGHTKEEFYDLLLKSPVYRAQGDRFSSTPDGDESEVVDVTLDSARHADYRDKTVRMRVRVSGRGTAPWDVPRQVTFTCGDVGSQEKLCGRCVLNHKGVPTKDGNQVVWVLSGAAAHENPLALIDVKDSAQVAAVQAWSGIPTKCPMPTYKVDKWVNLEEVVVVPEEPFRLMNDPEEGKKEGADLVADVHQSAYFAGFGMRANTPYTVKARRTVMPTNQRATFLIEDAVMEGTEVSNYQQTPDKVAALRVFAVAEGQAVLAKLDEIARDLTHNVTKIYGREHALVGMDLIYHSVISFYFQNAYEHKGWLEGLFVGDTRCGKSQIMRSLIRHYRLGEMVSAENCSFAGLIGGLQQNEGKRWFVSWGKFPLNDMGLLALDEISGLSREHIALMSGVRTEGIAEVNKIHGERALSRTRTIWSGNPRGKVGTDPRPLKAYPYGLTAVPELIGNPEDVARFEFAIGMATDDIARDEPNRDASERDTLPHVYTSELCHLLLSWVWSRTADQVIFRREAEKACLEYARLQGARYSARIPLITSANQRVKLARLAAACAARTFSTDATGEFIVVERAHVEAAYQFLEREYSRPSMDYQEYSRVDRSREVAAEQHYDECKQWLIAEGKAAHILHQYTDLKAHEVALQMGQEMGLTKTWFGTLHQWGMLQFDGGGYSKTPILVKILREIFAEKADRFDPLSGSGKGADTDGK